MKPAEFLLWLIVTVVVLPIYALTDAIQHLRGKGRVHKLKRK